MPFDIPYQTADFIIIYKPCGISVHKDGEKNGLTDRLAAQLGVERVWLVHRLDKATSGLLILALNAQSAVEFTRLFAAHQIRKTYLALSDSKPKKKQGRIIGDMKKSRNGSWKLLPTRENPAITRFHSVSVRPGLRLFILQPQTGKTHQLRVAMKSLGSPILGDTRYGKNPPKTDRTYLHAYRLDFDWHGTPVSLAIPPQEGQHWHHPEIQQCLHAMNNESEN